MPLSKIAGIGMYVPKNVVTNNDILKYMDTTDAWIQERTASKSGVTLIAPRKLLLLWEWKQPKSLLKEQV
jgi:3-oxoacyl-[acyl-carrier-protein] synthase III